MQVIDLLTVLLKRDQVKGGARGVTANLLSGSGDVLGLIMKLLLHLLLKDHYAIAFPVPVELAQTFSTPFAFDNTFPGIHLHEIFKPCSSLAFALRRNILESWR